VELYREQQVSSAPIAVIVLALAGLSGCCAVNPAPFEAFANSTHGLLVGADVESVQIAEIQRTFFIFAASAGKLERNSFEPIIATGGRQHNIDLARQFNERVAILQAIAGYADALSAFAKKDYQSKVDAASARLDGSLVSLAHAAGAGSEATGAAGFLATAVNALGHATIEYERVKGLRRAMGLAQPGLEKLAVLLVQGDDLIARQLRRYQDDILDDANATINASPSAISRVQVSALVAAPVSDATLSINRLAELNRSVALLPVANQELLDTLCTGSQKLSNLSQLVSEAQRLESFHAGSK